MSRRLETSSLVLGVLVAAAAALAAVASLHAVISAPWHEWNDGRLAPSAALLRGYELYYPDGEGPLLGHFYGPVSALFYILPLLATSTPSGAIILGSFATLILYLAPAVAFGWRASAGTLLCRAAAFLSFWLLAFQSSMLVAPAFNVHADTPALACGGLACAVASREGAATSRWAYPVAALLAVLAVGSKQVMLLLPVTIALYVGLAHGIRAAVRFAVAMGVVGTISVALLPLLVDVPAMLFNTVTVLARNPWRAPGGARQLVACVRDLVPRVFPSVMVVTAVGVAAAGTGQLRRENWRRWLADNRWSLLVMAGVVNVPLSLVGRAKVGGSMNALAFTGYFLALGAALALLQATTEPRLLLRRPTSWWARIALISLLGVLVIRTLPLVPSAQQMRDRIDGDPERAAFAYALAHPGQVYLPFNPLVTLLSEGKAYHFSDAIYARELGGPGTNPDQVRTWLPAGLEVIVTRRRHEDFALRFLPEFTRRPDLPELPGWKVYGRSADATGR